jgi:hypothetical protein
VNLSYPTINLGGSSSADLLDDYGAVKEALRVARERLVDLGRPHGRDYPDPTGGAFVNSPLAVAGREHLERVKALDQVIAEIDAIRENIFEQQRKRCVR